MYGVSLHGFPGPILYPRTDTERWRYRAFGARYRGQSPLRRAALAGFIVVTYPFTVAVATLENAAELRRRDPATGVRDMIRMYGMALLRNVPPVEYVFYRFQTPARHDAAQYLYWIDTPALQLLNRRRGATNADVQDKARFAALCREAGLPHVETVAVFRNGEQVEGQPLGAASPGDLWCKPLDRNGSQGSKGWTLLPNGSYRSGERTLDWPGLLDHLRRLNCIVQLPVQNHAEIDGITNGSAAVLRIVSSLPRKGEGGILSASVSLPVGTSTTTEGAMGYFLDLDTGALISPRSVAAPTHHPDTGAATLGRLLPFWDETKALVLHAHRVAFSRFATLGWDVVLTQDGPRLLEANSGWTAIGVQMQYGSLGRSALGGIISEELGLEV